MKQDRRASKSEYCLPCGRYRVVLASKYLCTVRTTRALLTWEFTVFYTFLKIDFPVINVFGGKNLIPILNLGLS